MGFYPYMKAKLERIVVKGERKIRAEAFCSITNKWDMKDFDGYDPKEALAWIAEHMNMLEM